MTKAEIHQTIQEGRLDGGPWGGDVFQQELRHQRRLGVAVLTGDENDLEILLSLYIDSPTLNDDELNEEYRHGIEVWLEAWLLLGEETTLSAIKRRIQTSPSSWEPLLKLATDLAHPEGNLWIEHVLLTAREKQLFSSELERLATDARHEIHRIVNQEWYLASKERSRQILRGEYPIVELVDMK